MTITGSIGLFALAAIVVVGSFAYFIVRGGSDAVIVPILAISLATVLQFFFAQHLSNSAATNAVAAAMVSNDATQKAADHATAAAEQALGPKV